MAESTAQAMANASTSSTSTISSSIDMGLILLTIKQKIGEGLDHIESMLSSSSNGSITVSNAATSIGQIDLNSLILERPERMAVLLLLPDVYLSNRASAANASKATIFGRLLVIANAVHMMSWARNGLTDPVAHWAKNGIKLSGSTPSDVSVAWLSVLGMGISGCAALVSGILGPHNHALSVFALGLQKFGLVIAFLNQARIEPSLQQNKQVMDLNQYNMRTGMLLMIYGVLLLWRNRGASNAAANAAPAYIDALEKRLSAKIDAAIANPTVAKGASAGASSASEPVKISSIDPFSSSTKAR